MSTTDYLYTQQHGSSRSCNCKDPHRPLGHEPGCVRYRPLGAWSDAEIAAELDRAECAAFTMGRALGRWDRRAGIAYEHYLKSLAGRNRAWRRLDDTRSLLRALKAEKARRDAAPRAVGEGGANP